MRHIFRARPVLVGALLLSVVAMVAGCGSASSSAHSSAYTTPAHGPAHIVVIMMENHATNEILGNTTDAPYINQLASQYGVATQYYGVTHPSLPNYLALISGDTQGIFDDCSPGPGVTCAPEEFQANASYSKTQLLTDQQEQTAAHAPHSFNGQTIADQLDAQHLTWKAYMENMPAPGFLGDNVDQGLYRAKHNPFVYFHNIANDPAQLTRVVPATQLSDDLQADNLPNFAFLAPNQCHDMHGLSPAAAQAENFPQCGYPASGLDHGAIALGDTYLSQLVPQFMHSKAWSEGMVLAIVWDEDDYMGYAGCCHSPVGVNGTVLGGANAPALILTSKGASHITDTSTQYNHYSLLATIEKVWGLSCLANACGFNDNQLMTKFFGS
jgi:hypothetical protein